MRIIKDGATPFGNFLSVLDVGRMLFDVSDCCMTTMAPNALLTGKLGAQRVIYPRAATC